MKIVLASDLFWPTINGISVFTKNLADNLSARGHEVVVFAPSQTGEYYIEQIEGYQVVRLTSINFPFYHNQTSPLPAPKKIAGKIKLPQVYINNGYRLSLVPYREVARFCDKFKPDVIHIQLQLTIGQAMMSYAKRRNIPVVSTNHSSPENLFDNLRLLAPFSPIINRTVLQYTKQFNVRADYATMPTQQAIDRHFKNKQAKMPIEPVSNGVDLSRFTPGRPSDEFYEKFNLPKDQKIVMNIGRVDAEKHISTLILAFKEVLAEIPTALLVIVGDGTDMANLQNLIYKLKIDQNVRFMGMQTGADLVDFHRVADVFVSASPTETQGIVFLEAAACGKPVIGVDVGAVKEICQNNINGFLCETDNSAQIAEGIVGILGDQKLAEEFSRNGLEIIKKHDLNYTIDKFEQIYEFVIKNKKPEPKKFSPRNIKKKLTKKLKNRKTKKSKRK